MSGVVRGRLFPVLAALALVLVFGVRAVGGLIGGIAYFRAVPRIDRGEYESALGLLEWSAIGPDREDALLLRAEVKRGLWRAAAREENARAERSRLLESAAADFLEAAWSIPAAGWPWAGLADIYDRLERERRGLDSDVRLAETGSWQEVGRDGAVSIGLVRKALEHHASDFVLWDQLALTLLRFGLWDEGLVAVRAAARAHPMYTNHPFPYVSPERPELLEAFAAGAREALGSAPMIDRRTHLVAIAKLEMRMEQPEAAEATLRLALDEPGIAVSSAFVRYWLGLALIAQGRDTEAEAELLAAAEEPVFEVSSLVERARIAQRQKDPERALSLLRQARWSDPTRLDVCMEFASLAASLEYWPEALQALDWASLVHPDDPRPSLQRVRILMRAGQRTRALQALREHESTFGEGVETQELGAMLGRGREGRKSGGLDGSPDRVRNAGLGRI